MQKGVMHNRWNAVFVPRRTLADRKKSRLEKKVARHHPHIVILR
jgi:hypothetical protein